VPSYDYPFNERIRTLLRLEDLFTKIWHYLGLEHQFDHHAALIYILQVLDVVDRAELKTDLLQELDRQRIVMESLRGNPSISEDILNEVLTEIEKTAQLLRVSSGKVGQALRDNEWLMSIKQRAVIPGGLCQFDVPSYHYWLGLSPERRKQDLEGWLATDLRRAAHHSAYPARQRYADPADSNARYFPADAGGRQAGADGAGDGG